MNKDILNVILVMLIALGILAPIASNDFMPNITDFANHSGLIAQAKKSLFSGDFPLRVASWQHNGYQYPEFQFYSPLPFTISAIVYGLFVSFNVYLALKVMYWLILVFAGIYTYRMGCLITRTKEIGILMAVSYILSPYFLINILARSAFTEAFAQGLIPFCLFYSFKFLKEEQSVKNFLLLSLSWFLIATSHLITYLNFSIFIMLLLLGMWLLKIQSFKKIVWYGFSYLYSILLSSWYIVPVILFGNKLNINHDISKLIDSNWLTPLSELFSFQSVSMMPLPGNGLLQSQIYPSLGWIFIISFIGVWYGLSTQIKDVRNFDKKFAYLLMCLFCFAIILTWSPINFWFFLPKFFQLSQFSYRFLTQTMWIGSLLFGIFLYLYLKGKSILHVFCIVLFILNSNGSWIHTLFSRDDIRPSSIVTFPDIGYGANDYLYNTKHSSIQFTNIQLPLKYSDGWLILDKTVYLDSQFFMNNPDLNLHIEGVNVLKKSVKLMIYVDDKLINKIIIPVGDFNLDIPVNITKIRNWDSSYQMKLKLMTSRYFIPNESSVSQRHLSLKVDSLYFKNAALSHYHALNAEQTQKHCYLKKINHQTLCLLDIPIDIAVLQLPILYYPKMLYIELDGVPIHQNYFSSVCGSYQCATIYIQPGKHSIRFKFSGINWSNWLSFASWFFYIILIIKNQYFNRTIKHFAVVVFKRIY